MNNKILVSVIIATKQEEENIANCIESIKHQRYPQELIEIIVVDNNSTDKTLAIARRYTEKVFSFGPERSSQRNFGIGKARGKYVLYLDADMILSEDVIAECVNKCENQGFIALYIPERIIGESRFSKIRDFERSFYNGTCIDAVRFIRRDKFLEIGGFDENLIACEDWDLDRRLKQLGRFSITQSTLYHNERKITLRKYLKKKSNYVLTINRYIGKWGRKDKLVKKQFGFFYRYCIVFFENRKWRRILKHPIRFLEVIVVRIIVGGVILFSKFSKTK